MSKRKDKAEDLISATKDDLVEAALESEGFRETILVAAQSLLDGSAGSLVGSLLGALAPRINGVILNYKNKRFERAIKEMISVLTKRVEVLENNYNSLSLEKQMLFCKEYGEMLLDSIIDERKKEKIEWSINGFVKLMNDNTSEDELQLFFDTLSSLTVLDVDLLKVYLKETGVSANDVVVKYALSADQLLVEKEKLVRLGMLRRVQDEERNKNVDLITSYLLDVRTQEKRTKKKEIKIPTVLKKTGARRYAITRLGREFLELIEY